MIDGDALARELVQNGSVASKDGLTASPRPGDGEQDSAELVGYFERLKTALQAAHEMPPGVDELYVSRVSFFLAADGMLSSVRVLNPSGNSEYDRSVVAAFAKVRSIGAVPGGQSGARTISFKMTE
ncbi:MAG: TonB C-terminal domain-containing protein [Opitutaceae bacterium]|nr:TonB C-terminal domain-containing protein [Opitutaceae bacterium]